MKLSEFIFESAKAAADYGDLNATYESFMLGSMQEDDNYASFIDKAYHEANAFLQRASVLGKTALRIKVFEPFRNGEPTLKMDSDCLRPVSLFQYRDDTKPSTYDVCPFRKMGEYVIPLGPLSPYRKVYIQYRVRVPYFKPHDIPSVQEITDANGQSYYQVEGDIYSSIVTAMERAKAIDIDLTAEYGLTDECLFVGIDWIKGRCREDKSKGHAEEMEAESRLNDIADDEFIYLQQKTGRNL